MPTLHLTPAEQKLFDALPEKLRSGYSVQPETLTFADTAEKLAIRVRNLHVKNEGLHAIRDRIATAKTAEDLMQLTKIFDFSSLSKEDAIELYYTMGPDPMTATIEQMIPDVRTAEDIEALASLTFIRHGVLTVLQ